MRLQNIYNAKNQITLFLRNEDGSQEIREVRDFLPYFYEPCTSGKFIGYDGVQLQRLFCSEPSQVKQRRGKNSYESDILFTKRFILDRISEITKSNTRYFFLDIEVQAKDEFPDPRYAKYPVSCITIYDNHVDKYKTFFIEDYESEYKMLEDFMQTVKSIKPDLLLAWNMNFDYTYLYNRVPDFPKKN